MRAVSRLFWLVAPALIASAAVSADFTRNEIQAMLAAAPAGQGVSFAGRSLAGLDLHDLDLTGADFSGTDLSDADLRGAKLVAAKLVGAKLPRAKLNLAWIMRADFSHADLSGAVLETLVVSAGLETLPSEAATFVGPISLARGSWPASAWMICAERTCLIYRRRWTCGINPWA